MQLKSQKMRKLAPELDPLRIGTGWTKEDLGKVQVIVESTYGDSHPGSGHLNILEEEVRKGIAEEGGFGARYHLPQMIYNEAITAAMLAQMQDAQPDRIILTGDLVNQGDEQDHQKMAAMLRWSVIPFLWPSTWS